MDYSKALEEEISDGVNRGRFDFALIEKLLHLGADPHGRLWGESYLHALADSQSSGAEVVARVLMAFGANPSSADVFGAQPLARASRAGNSAMARELIRAGADPRARDDQGEDAMVCALERVDEEMAQSLLAAGYPAKLCKDRHGVSGLMCIADHPKAQSLAFELIFRGADPNEQSDDGWTPLTAACRAGNAPMASLLISEGALAAKLGPSGLTALAVALGARPGRQTAGGSRVGPGHLACALRVARELEPVWGGRSDAKGLPPLARLYRSCARFELGWMESLAKAGANPVSLGAEGQSLLHVAAEAGLPRCSMALAKWAIAHGVKASLADKTGRLPEHEAKARSMFELEAFLRSQRESGELAMELPMSAISDSKRL